MITVERFNKIARYVTVFVPALALMFFFAGCYFAFFNSEADYQQGDFVRIMYVHVPSAWMALGIYSFIGISSIIYIIWRNQLMDIIARKSAMVGAVFALITLLTGSLWGKPVWGAWWVWDARLTSMLILFFFYLGYMALCNSLQEQTINSDTPAILAIIGLINIPIVKFSVDIWNTLHQPASVLRFGNPTIHYSMLLPLILMFLGCVFFFVSIVVTRVKIEIIQRKLLRSDSMKSK